MALWILSVPRLWGHCLCHGGGGDRRDKCKMTCFCQQGAGTSQTPRPTGGTGGCDALDSRGGGDRRGGVAETGSCGALDSVCGTGVAETCGCGALDSVCATGVAETGGTLDSVCATGVAEKGGCGILSVPRD